MGKTYFASDFHLGTPSFEASLEREKKLVSWLDQIKEDADSLFLVGDIFDFWFEYHRVVPKYHTRMLGKLAELSDAGVKIYFFKGNHDMWTFDYLQTEIGVTIIDEEWEGKIGNHQFYIHHGDGIGPGDRSYKLLRKLFRSRWATWLFHRLHPNFGVGIAQFFSKRSRSKNGVKDEHDLPMEEEFQYRYIQEMEAKKHRDYYIFGHRHKPRNERLANDTHFVNLGDWIEYFTYAVYDGNELQLKIYTA